jgi:hypothetical protein
MAHYIHIWKNHNEINLLILLCTNFKNKIKFKVMYELLICIMIKTLLICTWERF